MAHCTQLCTTKKKFYSQQIKKNFLGITLSDTFSLLFQKEKNLMPLFLIACNRGLTKCIYLFDYIYTQCIKFVQSLKSLRSENHTPHYYWLNRSELA